MHGAGDRQGRVHHVADEQVHHRAPGRRVSEQDLRLGQRPGVVVDLDGQSGGVSYTHL